MNCTSCILHKTSGVNCLSGQGPSPCDVMIIGEAPGKVEEEKQLPFVGDTGQLLNDEFIPILGLTRSQVYVTNAVRCRPPENRTPDEVEITACRAHLLQEIERVQPKLIILLGAVAVKSVLGLDGIEKHRGQFYNLTRHENLVVFPTYHPAKLWRAWQDYDLICRDFRKAALAIAQPPVSLVSGGEYKVCKTIKEVLWLEEKLSHAEKVAFDTETTGLDHQTDRLLCVSFSDEFGKGYTVPLLDRYELEYWSENDLKTVKHAIANVLASNVPTIMQNGAFDLLFCWMEGWQVNNFCFDTMQAAHLVDENLPCSLDVLVTMYTTMPLYSRELAAEYNRLKLRRKKALANPKRTSREYNFPPQEDRDLAASEENYSILPTEVLWKYAAQDADATFRVEQPLSQRMTVENLWELFSNITMPMIPFVATLKWHGIMVDQLKLSELQGKAEQELSSLSNKLTGELQIDTRLNVASNKQLKTILIDALKWPIVKKTKTGAPSFDNECMEAYRDQHGKKAAGTIIDIKKQRKCISDFLMGSDHKGGILKHISEVDSRVHPNYKLHTVVTGRLSTSDPAIHNIARGEMRHCYIPPIGWWWLETDYSQLELRILAVLSNCKQLLQWFSEGKDVHAMIASAILKIPPEQVTSEQRVRYGKNVNFGIVYGKREWSLATDLDVSVEEARLFLDTYFERLPEVKPFFDGVLREVYSTGRVRTAMGRVRHFHGATLYSRARARNTGRFPEIDAKLRDIERQAYNDPIQSPGSDILCRACIRISPRILPLRSVIVHHHHDAIHANCPPDELIEAARIIKEEMERPVPEMSNYSFPVDFKVCTAWYNEDEENTQWLMKQLQ